MTGGTGQGLIPADRILSIQASRGIAGLVDTAVVKADDGSTSAIQFRSYDMGREALQAQSIDLVWLDEMLTDDTLFSELLARGTAVMGSIWLTATPKKQQSPVSRWFREPGHADRAVYKMSTRNTTHFTPEMVSSMESSYSAIKSGTPRYIRRAINRATATGNWRNDWFRGRCAERERNISIQMHYHEGTAEP